MTSQSMFINFDTQTEIFEFVQNNDLIYEREATNLTTSLNICVNSWVSGNGVAIKTCVREFVEDWKVVSSDSLDL